MGGVPCRVRAGEDRLQPLRALVAGRRLAAHGRRLGEARRRRRPKRRQHVGQGAPLRRGGKRGAERQAIGRSRGGRTTKIHAVADARGRIVAFDLTPGQRGDVVPAPELVGRLPPARILLADAAYDSNAFRASLAARGTLPVIEANPGRKRPVPFDEGAYKLRNLIERAFCRIKDWRRVATRYDKLARNYAAGVQIAIIVLWWT